MVGEAPVGKQSAIVPARYSVSTVDLPVRHQFDLYREALSGKWDTIRAARNPADGFRFVFEDLDLGRLKVKTYEREASELGRTGAQIRKDGNDNIQISVMIQGLTLADSDDVELELAPGTLVMQDLTRPSRSRTTYGHAAAIEAPREVIAAMIGDIPALHNQVRQTVVGKLFCDHLLSLCRHMEATTSIAQIAEMTEHMLAAALAPSRDNLAMAAKPIGDLLHRRAIRHIDRHLLDPGLTPETIALSLGISRRALYRVFEPSGGVVKQIQARRLENAHAMLLDPSAPQRIKAIAYSHHFGGESQFARSFRRRFGYNPSDVTDVAQAKAAGPLKVDGTS